MGPVMGFKYRTRKRRELAEALDRKIEEESRQAFVIDSSMGQEEFKAAVDGIDWAAVFESLPPEE